MLFRDKVTYTLKVTNCKHSAHLKPSPLVMLRHLISVCNLSAPLRTGMISYTQMYKALTWQMTEHNIVFTDSRKF